MEEQKNVPRRRELDITFGNITEKNVEQLRRLNIAIFPVRYNDKFYQTDILKEEHRDVTKLVYHNDVLVGAVCCRLETEGSVQKLYIMTLGVLAPYRGYGIGSRILQSIIDYAETKENISEIFLHVQINNEDALRFYARFNFEIVGTVEKYYQRLEPSSAHILRRTLTHASSS
eukprot:TRINITY_DN1291_c0_g1_i4.p1 TRINITY_DN1291_c0_g1~~TRINITY_DN1291_c0_g1_i4.p1  ORF type:complete len:173 (+),score=52.89 TRINITY_DN1291_c0_g1_i4:57-575(+)